MSLELHQIELRYEALRSADPKKEKRLLGSMAEHGQQSPVVVIRGEAADRYTLIDGYKRIRALRKLASDTVLGVVWDLDDPSALVFERLLRMDQEDSALEQGWLVRALIKDFGLSGAEVSRRLDKSESWVSRRVGLVEALPQEALGLVRAGKICAHAAERFLLPLARAKGEDCLRFARAVAKAPLSSRQVAELHRGLVEGGAETRALVLENPALYLEAQAEAQRAAAEKKKKPPLEAVLDDLNIIASVSNRLWRKLHEPLLLLGAHKERSVSDALSLAKASFARLERQLGDVLKSTTGEEGDNDDARPEHAHGDLEVA